MELKDFVDYFQKVFDREVFQELTEELEFPKEREKCVVFGKQYTTPRDQLFLHFGNEEFVYKFSGTTLKSKKAGKTVEKLRNWIFENVPETKNGNYNVVLINRYLTGKDKVGWHADNEKIIDQSFPIISMSFGSSRKFQMRRNKSSPITTFTLKNGDVLVMRPGCQNHFIHQVPITTKETGIRYNLTFRSLI